MRVLLCYDGTPNSRAALPIARLLAECGAEIEVIRVVKTPALASEPAAAAVSGVIAFGGANAADLHRIAAERRWEEQELAYQRDLEDAIRFAREDATVLLDELPSGARLAIETSSGDPADILIGHTRDGGFDLIVMAAHSRSAVRELVIGSVTRAVLASRVAPVTLVNPGQG